MTSNTRNFVIRMARDCDANLLGSYAPFSSAHSEAAAAMEMEKSLSLSVCFELGKALRYSDAERFLSIYDSLLQDGSVEQDLQVRREIMTNYLYLPR